MAERILVVDDKSDDLETMKEILEKEGYDASIVKSGADALDMLAKKKFKLILLDILMPKLSGYEVLRIIREKFNHKAKLLYVSIVPKQEVDMSGVDGFIQKPFSPESLLAEVKKALMKE